MKRNLKHLFFILILFTACRQIPSKYQADWILVEATYKDIDILSYTSTRNLVIDSEFGRAPLIEYPGFENIKRKRRHNFKSIKRNKIQMIEITGSKFLSDLFIIELIGEGDCQLVLRNTDIYLRFIFNSETQGSKRRNCPDPRVYFKTMN